MQAVHGITFHCLIVILQSTASTCSSPDLRFIGKCIATLMQAGQHNGSVHVGCCCMLVVGSKANTV